MECGPILRVVQKVIGAKGSVQSAKMFHYVPITVAAGACGCLRLHPGDGEKTGCAGRAGVVQGESIHPLSCLMGALSLSRTHRGRPVPQKQLQHSAVVCVRADKEREKKW